MQRELMKMVADMLEDENEYKKFKNDVQQQHSICLSNKEYWDENESNNIFRYKITDFDVQATWVQKSNDFEKECTNSYKRYETYWFSK